MAKDTPYSGIYLNEPRDDAPEWLVGKVSLQLDKLKECIAYAKANGLVSEKGYVYFDVKISKKGEKYVDLNTYKKDKSQEEDQDLPF